MKGSSHDGVESLVTLQYYCQPFLLLKDHSREQQRSAEIIVSRLDQLASVVCSATHYCSTVGNDTASAADDYDWSVGSRARVVGCSAPQSAIFSEFRSLNPDERDPCYSSLQGMYETRCGLDNVLLTWTGPEYLYFLMKYNEVNMPDEGLKMLRLASLYDWHTKGSYAQFANDDDQDMQSFVADFDELNRVAKEEMRYADYEITSKECTRL